jgi:hypothetical protein
MSDLNKQEMVIDEFLIVVSALWYHMFNIFALQAQTHEAWGTRVQVVDAQPVP